MKTRRERDTSDERAAARRKKQRQKEIAVISFEDSAINRRGKVWKAKKPHKAELARREYARRVVGTKSPTRPVDFWFLTTERAAVTAQLRAKTHKKLADFAEYQSRVKEAALELETKKAREMATFKATEIPASLVRIFKKKEAEKKAAMCRETAVVAARMMTRGRKRREEAEAEKEAEPRSILQTAKVHTAYKEVSSARASRK